jgi:hypothetical protein
MHDLTPRLRTAQGRISVETRSEFSGMVVGSLIWIKAFGQVEENKMRFGKGQESLRARSSMPVASQQAACYIYQMIS